MGEPSTRLKLRLTPAAERAVRCGHPWVYAERVRGQNRAGEAGELAVIYDRSDRFLAVALFDPHSPIRLRVLHSGEPATIDDAWWRERVARSVRRRDGLFDGGTNGYRLVNGESDGLPALVVDRYADVLVVKIYSAAWLRRVRELPGWLTAACGTPPAAVVLRMSRNIAEFAQAVGLTDGDLLSGKIDSESVVFEEHGMRFEAGVVRGQKTGFFLDQRENRRRVGAAASGKDLLNVFSHTGAFSVYAACGGARAVTDVDISAHALEGARRNMALNPPAAGCEHRLVKADAFEWLAANRNKFGVVVIDPPSLARRESERGSAIAAYGRLAGWGAAALRQDGLLVAASCSAHVPAGEFYRAVREAVRSGGRSFEELETHEHPPDHPAAIPEARYLKAIYLRAR